MLKFNYVTSVMKSVDVILGSNVAEDEPPHQIGIVTL
jgi:hypothetical protein